MAEDLTTHPLYKTPAAKTINFNPSRFAPALQRKRGLRLLVCGDREWKDKEPIKREILRLMPILIIEGEARGADTLAREVAEELGIAVLPFPAQWKVYGRGAGPVRNIQMLTHGRPDRVLAFHNNLFRSKGTKHMVKIARIAGIPVDVFGEVIIGEGTVT